MWSSAYQFSSGGQFVSYKYNAPLLLAALMVIAIACAATVKGAIAATMTGNVAGWVKNATLIGPAPTASQVTIAVHMTLTDIPGLQALVTDVSTPSSPSYGHFLTQEQLGLRFAPAAADVEAVRMGLEYLGLTHVTVGPLGAYVSATATVGQLISTFHIAQNLYSYHGLTLRANVEEPTIPASLAGKVTFISGLDDTTMLRVPQFHSATMGRFISPPPVTPVPQVTPPPIAANNPSLYCNTDFGAEMLLATLSTGADVYGDVIPWLNCGYTPQQIRSAYGLDQVSFNGKGVTVAILDAYASPTLESDANRYAENHGLPPLRRGINFRQIIPDGIYNVNPADSCSPLTWWTEQSLDVAAVHGVAPGANILYIGAADCNTSLDVALMDALYGHLADVMTNSYGYNGEAIAPGRAAADDQALMAGAAQGMTVLFSSGDNGDVSQLNGAATGAWPATSAWVTGVGGTTLEILGAGVGKAEYGWGTYRAFLANATVNSAALVTDSGVETATNYGVTYDDYAFYSGSGGGISLLESQPAYQAGAVPANLAVSLNLANASTVTLPNAQRVSPDVAMVADPYTGYLYGETFTIAGNPVNDHGCTPVAGSTTEEYCEAGIGGTSLASPLMAGVMAVMDQARRASGNPVLGFANPWLYGLGSHGDGVSFRTPLNQIVAPTEPVALLRGYAANPNEVRVVTVNSVPFVITLLPFALQVCGLRICLGVNDVFNYSSLSLAITPPAPAGYNDVTGLGVPFVPQLVNH
jgi:subtilase family serine protease